MTIQVSGDAQIMGGRASVDPSRTQDWLLPPPSKRIGRGCEFTVLVYPLTDVKITVVKVPGGLQTARDLRRAVYLVLIRPSVSKEVQ